MRWSTALPPTAARNSTVWFHGCSCSMSSRSSNPLRCAGVVPRMTDWNAFCIWVMEVPISFRILAMPSRSLPASSFALAARMES